MPERTTRVDEVKEAAPWLLGEAPAGGVAPDELFEKLQPFKERVAEDIREED
jgi:hypothetical protein